MNAKSINAKNEPRSNADFSCRIGCGACCVAPSINAPFLRMPNGKKAGERCVHLDENNLCKLYGLSDRPSFCAGFKPSFETCGEDAQYAMRYLSELEELTRG